MKKMCCAIIGATNPQGQSKVLCERRRTRKQLARAANTPCSSARKVGISVTSMRRIKLTQLPQGGTGVICETRALPGAVIPAQAGIYSGSHWKCAADGLDSRLRGNDQCLQIDPIPNDTKTATL